MVHCGNDLLHYVAYLQIQLYMKAAKSVNRYAVKKYRFVFPTIYESGIFSSHEKFTVNLIFFQTYLDISVMMEIVMLG